MQHRHPLDGHFEASIEKLFVYPQKKKNKLSPNALGQGPLLSSLKVFYSVSLSEPHIYFLFIKGLNFYYLKDIYPYRGTPWSQQRVCSNSFNYDIRYLILFLTTLNHSFCVPFCLSRWQKDHSFSIWSWHDGYFWTESLMMGNKKGKFWFLLVVIFLAIVLPSFSPDLLYGCQLSCLGASNLCYPQLAAFW